MNVILKQLALAASVAASAFILSSCGGGSDAGQNPSESLPDFSNSYLRDDAEDDLIEGEIRLSVTRVYQNTSQGADLNWDFVPKGETESVQIVGNGDKCSYDAVAKNLVINFKNIVTGAPAYSGTLNLYLYRINEEEMGVRPDSTITIDNESYQIVTDKLEIDKF